MTVREAATWLGVPDDEDLEHLLRVPPFRRAVLYVANGHHQRVYRGLSGPYPRHVFEKFHIPQNRNGDIDLVWLRDVATTISP